ncbi:unnamed protein product [Clonostachys rosea]|uniref:Uncharacterized protein n=1 Tax=Bionectria ochroleuca TaxID=29856 RepID=A0ABY6U7K9_BIOOC|nr:unnamed protein product [Clonostachys rosea]
MSNASSTRPDLGLRFRPGELDSWTRIARHGKIDPVVYTRSLKVELEVCQFQIDVYQIKSTAVGIKNR